MSFILDALRKSENERQQQGQAEFAGVPSGGGDSSSPRWIWIVGLLLAINLAVLAGILMRQDAQPAVEAPPAVNNTPAEQPRAEPTFSDRVAAAQRDIPEQSNSEPVVEREPEADVVEPVVITQNPDAIDSSRVFPTLQEVAAAGRVSLPPLHLDIHVFSETPADRFVFINMSKYREGSRIDEGPLVDEITPEGAILVHQGVTFLLPRE